jgi:hypothetical protein
MVSEQSFESKDLEEIDPACEEDPETKMTKLNYQ